MEQEHNLYIAILLTVHNRKEKTLECLSALYEQKMPDGYSFDVYLTNDGCTDGTPDEVKVRYPEVNIIQGDGTLFWNRGMYKAWDAAAKAKRYDFYLWLNDDTFLLDNSLNQLLQASLKKENSIIVGSTLSIDRQTPTYGGRNEKGHLIIPNDELQRCFYFNGNIVLIPSNVFERVGLLDYAFHHALGDFDYGLRASKMSVECIVAEGYLGICEGHSSFPKCFNPKVKIKERLKAYLNSTSGSNPSQLFRFEKKHRGILIACKSLLTNSTRVFFPILGARY